MIEFKAFPKIPRLNREVIWTEKLDGTNACVAISDDGQEIIAQSRNRIITPKADNYGFAGWVEKNRESLIKLGPGHHYGEWYGSGIARNYGLLERRFALFNVGKWQDGNCPACCCTVPVIGTSIGFAPEEFLQRLRIEGSLAVPGFKNPEGLMGFHIISSTYFKVLLENDEIPKGIAV